LGSVDLIVCNPPYISAGKLEGESARLLDRQPRGAFDAGPYGLAIHQRVITDGF
jgi:methylase of polypeptide subunit release factors